MKKTILALALIAAAGFTQITVAAPFETTPAANEKLSDFDEGKKAVDAKEWRKAVRSFEAVVKKSPDNADAHNLLAYSQRWLGNMDASFKHYAEALRLNPNHRAAHEYVGQAYLKVKNPAKANEHLAKLEALCGKSCEEYTMLAQAIAAYK
jgi:predicted Zn-dependent protease